MNSPVHRLSAWFAAGLLTFALTAVSHAAAAQTDAPGGADAVARPAEPARAADAPESLLHWLARTLGLRYVVIFLFLTVNLVALAVVNLLAAWRENVVPPALIRGIESRLADKQPREACDLIRTDRSLLGRILAAGVARLGSGYEAAEAAMRETGSFEILKIDQRLGYLGLIAQLAPMLGLVGTVDGMASAFAAIAQTHVAVRPADLAAGIGTALATTLVGLWIAVVAVTLTHLVRNRMDRLIAELGILASDILKRLDAANKKP